MAFLLGLQAYVYSSVNFIPAFHLWTCVHVLGLNNKGYELNCLKQQTCMPCSSRTFWIPEITYGGFDDAGSLSHQVQGCR